MARELSRVEKKRRVVLKRVNSDSLGMRSDFLRTGTMAQVIHNPNYLLSVIERREREKQPKSAYLWNYFQNVHSQFGTCTHRVSIRKDAVPRASTTDGHCYQRLAY